MFVLITFVLLFLSISVVIALRLTRPGAGYTWVAAVAGALFAWISILLWQFRMPPGQPAGAGWRFTLAQWSPQTLFSASPQISANPVSWLYALSLGGLAAAVILTSPARTSQARTSPWLATLACATLGILAVLMDNPVGLVLAWMAIDLTEFGIAMYTKLSPDLVEGAMFSLSIRLAGVGFAIWASVLGASNGQSFSLESTPPQAGLYLLLAAGLRLGVLLPYWVQGHAPALRRGFATVLRMVSAAASLLVLARVPFHASDAPQWLFLLLFTLTAFAALYGGWKWLFARDELNGRPYWVIGMGALSMAAALGGNPVGAAAWGAALILFGAISFLYSAKQIRYTRVLAGLGLFMLALPYTLTASGWQSDFPQPFVFWPLFIIAHAMLVAGYMRHLARPGADLAELPIWARAAYPAGMAILVASILLGGLWGWSGALRLGAWVAGLASLLLCAGMVFAFMRLPVFERMERPGARFARFTVFLEVFPRLLNWLYQLTSRLILYFSALLEGDGGLLWTLLLLVLLASFLRGR